NASDPAWNDITEFVLQVSIRRGKEKYGERFPSGTCSIMLDNHEGLFSPGSDAHTALWHLPCRPGRLILVVAVPDPDDPDSKVALFTGRIHASNDTYGPAGQGVTTHVEAYDAAAEWAAHNPLGLDMLSLPQTGVQLTSERVHAA